MKFVCFAAVFCAVLLFTGNALAQSSEPYKTVEIGKFTVGEGVEFSEKDISELTSYLVINFNRSRRFENVFLSSDPALQSVPARRARITGTITKYSKGSRAARYLVGFGAGRTKLVANVKVTDAETGNVLIEQSVDGYVYGGLFGGDTGGAKGDMSSEIIKTMTKKGYASKQRLKK
jgi:Domain of unknown function (DUF4410)